jgi:hypothetical protein
VDDDGCVEGPELHGPDEDGTFRAAPLLEDGWDEDQSLGSWEASE